MPHRLALGRRFERANDVDILLDESRGGGAVSMPSGSTRKSSKVKKKTGTARASAKAATPRPKPRTEVTAVPKKKTGSTKRPRLLSGGNPQISKADGEAPVQSYLNAMPGWKRGVGRRLDALVVRTVPGVRKAVRWNTPFYGVDAPDAGWFMAFHCITKYVKVTFFRGTSLRPAPPVESKVKDVRYFHIHESDELDEKLVMSWIRQASKLPGEMCF